MIRRHFTLCFVAGRGLQNHSKAEKRECRTQCVMTTGEKDKTPVCDHGLFVQNVAEGETSCELSWRVEVMIKDKIIYNATSIEGTPRDYTARVLLMALYFHVRFACGQPAMVCTGYICLCMLVVFFFCSPVELFFLNDLFHVRSSRSVDPGFFFVFCRLSLPRSFLTRL